MRRAQLRIEIGRSERLPVDKRICFHCNGLVEDKLHIVTVCPLYQDLCDFLFAKARGLEAHFDTFSNIDKLCFVMSNRDLVHVLLCPTETWFMFCYVQQRLGSCKCQNLQ